MRWKTAKETILLLPAAAAFALLIFRGETAASAAQTGLQTCLRSVIPSLFPFLVLTNLLLRLDIPGFLLGPLGRGFEALFRIRRTALPALFAGLIGGYPLGAEAAAESCSLGLCTKEEAGRLMIFANNCSPAFLFGLVGGMLPGGGRQAVFLLLLQWFVSLCLGILLGLGWRPSKAAAAPGAVSERSFFELFTSSVRGGGRSVLVICAYVVFFSVFSAFLPESPLLRGTLEMTGGILLLKGDSFALITAAFLTGWGGLSVACQVFSALEGSGITAWRYLPLRLLHGLLMALGALAMQFGIFYLLLFVTLMLSTVIFVKYCGNRAPCRV